MKTIGLTLICLSLSLTILSQDRIPLQSCYNSVLKQESDTMKQTLRAKGYVLLKEASVRMESEYEMPVVVPLNEGNLYAIVFIGDTSSKLYEVRMYDWDERQVIYKKNGMENNIIAYQYVPQASEYHVIKTVQVTNNKAHKQLCGYIMLFKKEKPAG